MNFPILFFSLILCGMLAISVYEVIRASSLQQWKRLGCLTIPMLAGIVLFGLVLFFRGFALLFLGLANVFFAFLLFGGVAFLLIALVLAFCGKRWKSPAAIGALALSGYLCVLILAGPESEWRDGDIVTYEMDDGRTRLGRELSSGTYIGLISEDVVAVGSDENWIVVERRNSKGKNPQFYILPKNSTEQLEMRTLQSLTPEAFEKEVIAKSLPPFSWHKKQTP